MKRFIIAAGLVGSGLLMASCAGTPAGSSGADAPASPTSASDLKGALSVRVLPGKESFEPWSEGEVLVKVMNRSAHPLLVNRILLVTDTGKQLLEDSRIAECKGTKQQGKILVEGRFLVDDPGPEARLPMPPRWDWVGNTYVATFDLLAPQGVVTQRAKFRARYDLGGSFVAKVDFRVVSPDAPLYKAARKTELSPDGPAEGRGSARGWVEESRTEIEFQRIAARPENLVRGIEALPSMLAGQYAMETIALRALPRAEVEARTVFAIQRFAFDIEEARAKCGVKEGPYTRALQEQLWVVRGEKSSYLVRPDGLDEVKGDAIPLVDALNEVGQREVILGEVAEARDPLRVLTELGGRGFDAQVTPHKVYRRAVTVRVKADSVSRFFRALSDLGYEMRGADEALSSK